MSENRVNRYDHPRHYDHTAYLAKKQQNAPQWEVLPIDDNKPVLAIENAIVGHEGSTENTSGMDRSKALLVRLLPFTAVWLVLAVAIGLLSSSGIAVLLVFSFLTAVTYFSMDRTEYQFSRNGLERHKVDTLADLKRQEMHHAQELKRLALQSYLKQLEDKNRDE